MKRRKFKLIVPSFLAILVSVLLIAGTTYALFTSQATNNLVVSSGKVDLKANLIELEAYSAEANNGTSGTAGQAEAFGVSSYYDYVPANYDSVENIWTFANKGTAKITAEKTLDLDKMTPGDKVTLTMKLTNNSNVDILYRVRLNALNTETSDPKLLEALEVTVGDELLKGIISVGSWAKWLAPAETPDEKEIDLAVVLPIDTGNDYQNISVTLRFTIEAVQANAATDEILDKVNKGLKESTPKVNSTMYDAYQEAKSILTNLEIDPSKFVVANYLWSPDTDQFYSPYTVEPGFESHFFKVYTHDQYLALNNDVKYGVYAVDGGNTDWPANLTINHSFDAGEVSTITSILYDRSTAQTGKESLIRTNSSFTNLTINAELDVVHHYGDAGILNIIAVAGNSYHEFGNVTVLDISKGRVALEETSSVEQIHISAKTVYNEQTNEYDRTNEFNPIIIAIDENISTEDKPTFSRDDVVINPNGTLVVAIQTGTEEVTEDTQLDYVWLTKQGIFEQIKVSETKDSMEDAKWADDSTLNATNTQSAAIDIANNIGRVDSQDPKSAINATIEVTETVEEVEQQVQYTIGLDEDRNLVLMNNDQIVAEYKVEVKDVVETVEQQETTVNKIVVTKTENQQEVEVASVNTSTVVAETGLTDLEKQQQQEQKVTESQIHEIENNDDYHARIGTKGYETLTDAIDAAQDGEIVVLVADIIESVSISKNITIDLDDHSIIAESNKAALTLYSLDNATIKNGKVYGQIKIGERKATIIKWKHLNYGDDLYEAVYGYHPLAPAKNVRLIDLIVDSGNKPSLFFTNIEEDLVRGASSNYCDNDLYGHYIYKTGYTTKDQYINNQKDEVFTACSDRDFVKVIGGSYNGSSFVGNMLTYDGEQIEGVLTVSEETSITSDDAGRFVENGTVLVGLNNKSFIVSDVIPDEYTARVNNVYYTYTGGANDAIKFAKIGETVYINENADAVKEIAQGESFTVVSLSENVSWTGATVTSKVENPANYEICETPDELNPLMKVYTLQFIVVARVYHVGDSRRTPNANTSYDEYGSLKAAVAAAGNGDYVMLMRDTIINDSLYINSNYERYGINLSARMVLDLNGHTYTYTGPGTAIICTANTGTDGGQRAIRDSSEEKTGTVYATNGYAFAKYNQKSERFVIYGGNFVSATTNAVWVSNANTFIIEGGTFISLNNETPILIDAANSSTISNTITTIQTQVGSEQYLVINPDGTYSVNDLTKIGDDYNLVVGAGKYALLPYKPKSGYTFNWILTNNSKKVTSGIVLNSSNDEITYQTQWIE